MVAVQGVAPVVAGPVGHGLDEALRLAGQPQDLAREREVLDLVAAADVVDLAVAASAQHEVERRAVVEHVDPVAHVAAVAVERQRLVVEGVGDEERDDLLGVLVGAEVVRRARDHDRHAVRVRSRPGRGDRRPPWRPSTDWSAAADRVSASGARGQAAVHLVGADVKKARDLSSRTASRRREHAEDVGAEELVGLHERAIDVRLGGEVDHRVHAARHVAHELGVADVALDEAIARVALARRRGWPGSPRRSACRG